MGQKTSAEPKRESPTALLYQKMARYLPPVAVLLFAFVGSEVFLIRSPAYSGIGALIFLFSLPLAVAVLSYFIGIVFEIYDRKLTGTFFKSFVAQSTFIFFILDSSFSILSFFGYAYLLSPFLVSLLFLTNALLLNRFSDKVIGGKENQAPGLAAKRLAIALGIAFVASFLSLSFLTEVIGYPLYYSALAYGILSISPLIAFSKPTESFREAGLYLMRTTLQWAVVAFFVGVAALILTYFQNNYIAYAAVITLTAIVIGTVGFRIYSLGSAKIARETMDVYQKHEHKLEVVQDESFDFLRNNVSEFIRTGKKENLLIALTTLLTNGGFPFETSQVLLRDISYYEIPPIHKIPYFAMRKSFEFEVEKRAILINITFQRIAQETSVAKTT